MPPNSVNGWVVMQYLTAENVYGTECISCRSVFQWCKDFRNGSSSIGDRSRPSQAIVSCSCRYGLSPDKLITTQEMAHDLMLQWHANHCYSNSAGRLLNIHLTAKTSRREITASSVH
ncbi:hypothetical protein TNCV_3065451 [Trichonephila clavipes]|uniref:Transposase n=1 Tax=Trichonephila clavipes TaxID=2585209 RepID=A0A8X6RRE1_TRICX|nr:hypothetical protein TNCV_3065451 [Trichonephila clavipes]